MNGITGENRRRRTQFKLRGMNHFIPLMLGALAGALVVHLLGYLLLSVLGVKMDFSNTAAENETGAEEVLRPIVLPNEETQAEELAPDTPELEPDEQEPVEMDMEELTVPDLENVVIQPGETDLGTTQEEQVTMPDLTSSLQTMGVSSADQAADLMPSVGNPEVVIPVPALPGKDEQGLGSASSVDEPGQQNLSDLLGKAPGALGKKSGHGVIGADLLFEYDKAILKQSAGIGLIQLAALITKHKTTSFIIEGHTDSFGGKDYNHLLSLLRANAVREWLKTNNVDVSHVYIRACGDDRRIVADGDKDKQAPNRRVEIHMRAKGEALPEGSLPASYKVDMVTPIATQLARKNAVATPGAKAPNTSQTTNRPSVKPLPAQPVPSAEAVSIPVAEPVDDVPEAIPYAEPLED